MSEVETEEPKLTYNDIKLGMEIRDRVTSYQGIADHRISYMYGVERICIQPPAKDGVSMPDACVFDITQLEIINPEQVIDEPEWGDPQYPLGTIVKDKLTKRKGSVVGHAFHLNGCIRACVQTEGGSLQKEDQFWVYEEQLDQDKNILGKEKKPKAEPARRSTGGPSGMPSSKL